MTLTEARVMHRDIKQLVRAGQAKRRQQEQAARRRDGLHRRGA